ncbi:hypothetical protein CBL_10963 [Carabus blaptoides fortunei]
MELRHWSAHPWLAYGLFYGFCFSTHPPAPAPLPASYTLCRTVPPTPPCVPLYRGSDITYSHGQPLPLECRSWATRYRVMIPAVHRCKLLPGPACPAELIAIGDQEPTPGGEPLPHHLQLPS